MLLTDVTNPSPKIPRWCKVARVLVCDFCLFGFVLSCVGFYTSACVFEALCVML